MSKANNEVTTFHLKVARIQSIVLSIILALIFGFGLFIMTIWLVIKGGPNVGAHLKLLSQFYIGYSVTWYGSVIGLIYGIVTGAVIGWFIAKIYNFVVEIRHRQ